MHTPLAPSLLGLTLLLLGACGTPPDDPEARTLVQRLRQGDTQEREAASHALRRIGERGFSALRPLFDDPDAQVRTRAVFVWNRYADASARHVGLAATLIQDDAWVVRRESARMLSRVAAHSEAAQTVLIDALEGANAEFHPTVLEALALGLGAATGSRQPRAQAHLVRLAAHGAPTVRAVATQALGQLGRTGPDTRAALLAAMQADDSPLVRMRAAEAWWRLTGESTDALAHLRDGLFSGRAGVPEAALEGLRRLGTHARPVVPALVTLLDDHALRVRAAETLGALGSVAEPALPRLIEGTRDLSAWFREAAERAVRSIRGS